MECAQVGRGTLSIIELCGSYRISRKTGYKWIERYLPAGLYERSRRPGGSPNQTPPEVVQAIIEARQRHPSWSGKASDDPSQEASTLGEMPSKLPPLEYPDRFELRYVSANGGNPMELRLVD